MTKFLLVGSAHIDIVAESITHGDTIDRPAEDLKISFGGTAANVAVNLSSLDNDVTICTATNSSPISNVIIEELEKSVNNVLNFEDDGLPEAGFSVHLHNGEMKSAVTAVAVEKHFFKADKKMKDLVRKSDCVVLDCNLNEDSLKNLSRLAIKNNKKLAYLLVSESKGLKISQLPAADYLFSNVREFQYLQLNSNFVNDPKSLYIVTKNENGASAFLGELKVSEVKAVKTKRNKNFLGAGDAFAASFLSSIMAEKSINSAMEEGAIFAAKVLDKSNANIGKADTLNQQISRLQRSAYRDKLTNLLNRTGCEKLLQEYQRSQKPFAVLLFDIDHFKKINDQHGHDVGDKALIKFAEILSRSISGDDNAIRLGGEEFVVITPVSIGLARSMAERIRKHVEKHGAVKPIDKMTVSTGIALCESVTEYESSLKQADQALYQAKNNGRNQVVIAE